MLDMNPIEQNQNGNNTVQLEELKQIPHFIKLSNWILRLLKITGVDCDYTVNGILVTDITRRFIIEFMKYLNIKTSYLIPKDKNEETEMFFMKAYNDTKVLKDYYL